MRIDSGEALKARLARRNKIRTIFSAISYVFSILIILCAADILYQKFVKRADSVSIFGYQPYIVLSGSMEPAISTGDMVIARRVKETRIASGDIVTFLDADGVTVTHRIIDVIVKDGKNYYRTKGDNNSADDIGLISMEDIKGKYCFKISRAGLLVRKVMTPQGLMLLGLAIVLLYTYAGKKSDRRTARHLIRKRHEKQRGGQERE